jgi:hypothetical protein
MLVNANTRGQCGKSNRPKCSCCNRHSNKQASKIQKYHSINARSKLSIVNEQSERKLGSNKNPINILSIAVTDEKPLYDATHKFSAIKRDSEMPASRNLSITSDTKRPCNHVKRSELLPNRFTFIRARSYASSCNDNSSSYSKLTFQSTLKADTVKSSLLVRRSQNSKNESFSDSFQNEDYGLSRFSCGLSKIGQCAMLKTYEDELYSKMKMKFPKNHFPRVQTPLFNTNADLKPDKQLSSSSLSRSLSCTSLTSIADDSNPATQRKTTTSESSWDTTGSGLDSDNSKKYQISKQIEDAMEILDDLVKIKSGARNDTIEINDLVFDFQKRNDQDGKNRPTESNTCDPTSIEETLMIDNTIKKYERWHFNWTRILTDMF